LLSRSPNLPRQRRAFGRYPLYVVSSLVYLVFFIPTAYGQNIVRLDHRLALLLELI